MSTQADKKLLKDLDRRIQSIKTAAQELQELSGGMEAVYRNADRILASTKVLEINITDLLDVL
jgi:hypothetical protein